MSIAEHRDWHGWHDAYKDSTSDLSRRLEVVQEELRSALPDNPTRRIQIVSMCAGQGHDVIATLAGYTHAEMVDARLVELNPRNVEAIHARAAEAGVTVEVVQGDAANSELYKGAIPADIVIAVGIFGNISEPDVYATIRALPQFCAPGATLLWSRGRRRLPDIGEQIRSTFAESGFVETAYHAPEDCQFRVGVVRYDGEPQPLQRAHLFTFVR